ncbi:hypothetical protein LUX29_03960 [Aureimonas altamirensis]|uniref:RraA family protein n=1 Tax=Aureimonas altamirensis TaxID=370622 RepID=UPI001E5102EB|nr:hypothetical protein [Aureimonas altamirensis]UHD46388.1 hypothetical protein LUX29_03960 [Aureimonas altamirensis]
MSNTSSDALITRLSALETGQVSDVLDEAGYPNHALSSDLFPLIPGKRFAGRAACLRGEPFIQGATQVPAVPGNTLETLTTNGTIIVIEAGGFQSGALLGGFVAYSLQRAGALAIVTDGAIRDADEIRELGLQCVQRTITPLNGARRWRMTRSDGPISLPGQTGVRVEIHQGDLLLGDSDGVVVVPGSIAQQIIEDTEELQRIEWRIGEALRNGAERAQAFAANPRFAHIRPALNIASNKH